MDLSAIRILEYAIFFLVLYVSVFYILLSISKRDEILRNPRQKKEWVPKISFIIPAYNEEKNIGKCMESLIEADYPDEKKEIIVIDDGSTDGTFETAKQYEIRPFVKVYRKENGGKALALNYGIDRSHGEIITTLDSDSYIDKKAIKKMLPHFEDDSIYAVASAVKVSNKDNFIEKLQEVEYVYTIFTRKMLVLIESVYVTPGPFSMFRRVVFEKLGGFDPDNILEDQEIAMRIQSNNYKIRSSMDAVAYTKVPATFMGLIKQRIRWHRGGLRNALKYLNMMHPRYGDFGVIVMPLSLLGVAALFGVMLISIYRFFYSPLELPGISISNILLGVTPIHILGAIILLITFWWAFYCMGFLREEEIKATYIIAFVLSYTCLITLFWILTFAKELTLSKLKW